VGIVLVFQERRFFNFDILNYGIAEVNGGENYQHHAPATKPRIADHAENHEPDYLQQPHYLPFFVSFRYFRQRAFTALRAIAERLAFDSFVFRAIPPFSPPKRPSATAAGFLTGASGSGSTGWPVAILTTIAACWLKSR